MCTKIVQNIQHIEKLRKESIDYTMKTITRYPQNWAIMPIIVGDK